jgi:FkbM family methyltransferase
MSISRIMRGLARRVHYLPEKIRYRYFRSHHIDCFETICVLLKYCKPVYLCDIGANNGHWSSVMRRVNPDLKHVVMFEPQKKYLDHLNELKLDGVTKKLFNCGLGSSEETKLILGGGASASLFEASSNQLNYFPNSIDNNTEQIEISLLDKIYADNSLPFPDVIKLDVQGYELNVLKGGLEVFTKAKYIVIELSMREFYIGQPPLWELLKCLEDYGFTLIDKGYEWRTKDDINTLLQFDAIFVNKKYESET